MAGMLTPWYPERSFGLIREMEEMMDRFLSRWQQEWPRWFGEEWVTYPRLESYVEDNNLLLRADLPGVDPKDLEITVQGNRLTIKGERKAGKEQEHGTYHFREIRYGTFARTVTLPAEVKTEDIKARYHNGVLEIRVPLPKELAARRIPIEAKPTVEEKMAA